MKSRIFNTKAVRHSLLASANTARFQFPISGSVTFDETKITFQDWLIYYKDIQSASLQIIYAFGIPAYSLVFTDGVSNYMFKVPHQEADLPFPFEVTIEGRQGMWRRFIWVEVLAALLIILCLK